MDRQKSSENGLGKLGHHCIDQINQTLTVYLKDYVSQLDAFTGINARYNYIALGGTANPDDWFQVHIYDDHFENVGFKAYIRYEVDEESKKICFALHYSKGLDPLASRKNKIEKNGAFIMEDERFFEPEIFDKDYVRKIISHRYYIYKCLWLYPKKFSE